MRDLLKDKTDFMRGAMSNPDQQVHFRMQTDSLNQDQAFPNPSPLAG